MDRRSFLCAAAAVPLGLGGCLGSPRGATDPTAATETASATPTETPTATTAATERVPPDCEDPSRPEPETGSDSVEPATYPSRAESPANEAAVADYVQAYEAAYRRNALLEEHGGRLDNVQIGIGEPRFFESPPGSVIARVSYRYGYRVGSTHADSTTTHASYYVDDAVVVRAGRAGPLEDESELVPDPLANGTVLECLE